MFSLEILSNVLQFHDCYHVCFSCDQLCFDTLKFMF